MRKNKGFTMIELLVTLALVAIIAGFAIPSFATLIANNRISSTSNLWIGALNYARSESIKRGRPVLVSALASAGNGNEWGGGWRIWVDQGSNGYDAGEEIRVYSEVSSTITIDALDDRTEFRFLPNGFVDPSPTAGPEYTFQLCDDRTGETGRVLNIHTSGRIRTDSMTCG